MKLNKPYLVLLLLLYINSYSQVIYQKSLKSLVHKSNLIVYGKVISVDKISPTMEPNNYDEIVSLEIKEVLQGEIIQKTIEIKYHSYHSCAPRPNFNVGENTLVFIWNENGLNHILGYGYGVKTLQNDDYDLYKKRIYELQEIQTISDVDIKTERMKKWVFMCLENPVTKVEGVSEFSESFRDILNESDKQKLKELILSKEKVDYESDFVFAQALNTTIDHEIHAYFIENLKSETKESILYVFEDYFKTLSHLGNQDQNKQLLQRFNSLDDYKDVEKMLLIRDEFVVNILNN